VCWPIRCGVGGSRSTRGILAPDEPGRPRHVLSFGETTGDKGMNSLVALRGYTGPRAACREGVTPAERTRLTCYSGAGPDSELADRAAADPLIRLVGLQELYG
jgi:uncharacterized protein